MNQNQVEKMKKAAASIELVGLFLVLYNLVFIFIIRIPAAISLFMSSMIFGLVFFALGWQIRKNPTVSSKSKFIASLVISLILLVSGYITTKTIGGLSMYLLLIILVSSILGIDAVGKMHGPSDSKVSLKGKDKVKDLLKMVSIAIVVIGLFIAISYFALN